MRILLLTRSYPRDGDLYQYPFVHRRVVAYRRRGFDVRVVQLGDEEGTHLFDNVECRTVRPEGLPHEVEAWAPDIVAVHGLDEYHWSAIDALDGRWPVCAWLHGSEIPAFFRAKAQRIDNEAIRQATLEKVNRRVRFWQDLVADWPDWLSLVFVSSYSIELMRQDVAWNPPCDRVTIIHNPIDTNLFDYQPKSTDDRYRILSIRPYDSLTYGNDLAVKSVQALTGHPDFLKASFTFVGDGAMFDDVLAPLRSFPNVTIRREFLRQEEIAALHRSHGVFLVPTRLDTQGVSRDEAMASGLVPVTNAVCSIPEFVDEGSAILAAGEDSNGLANGIATLFDDPQLFLDLSAGAARRVRAQSAHQVIIRRELEWMESQARAAT